MEDDDVWSSTPARTWLNEIDHDDSREACVDWRQCLPRCDQQSYRNSSSLETTDCREWGISATRCHSEMERRSGEVRERHWSHNWCRSRRPVRTVEPCLRPWRRHEKLSEWYCSQRWSARGWRETRKKSLIVSCPLTCEYEINTKTH